MHKITSKSNAAIIELKHLCKYTVDERRLGAPFFRDPLFMDPDPPVFLNADRDSVADPNPA